MSYNQSFCNNFTFQPPMWPPPNYTIPPPPPPNFNTPIRDQDFLNTFNSKIPVTKKIPKTLKIHEIKHMLCTIVDLNKVLSDQEAILQQNFDTFSQEEWQASIDKINDTKRQLDTLMAQVNDKYLENAKRLLAKRSAKRLRLKRLRDESKREKEVTRQHWEETSRKIDERLQKIQDDIAKNKLEEQSKIQADIVLKEVLRKKHDANKSIAKLDALTKLRRARQNTAKGRGASVTENDGNEFNENIEKVKALWLKKLDSYKAEEESLREKLRMEENKPIGKAELKMAKNLRSWKKYLFGERDASPQTNFGGDVASFVAVRWQWDRYINEEGSTMPIGWVVPP